MIHNVSDQHVPSGSHRQFHLAEAIDHPLDQASDEAGREKSVARAGSKLAHAHQALEFVGMEKYLVLQHLGESDADAIECEHQHGEQQERWGDAAERVSELRRCFGEDCDDVTEHAGEWCGV
jgi:hypothetical protein